MIIFNRLLILSLLAVCLCRKFVDMQIYPNWLDEILMILYIIFGFLTRKAPPSKREIITQYSIFGYIFLLCYGIILSILNGISSTSIFFDMIDILKLPIFFLLFLSLRVDNKTLEFAKWSYIFLNIPSICMGLFQWFSAKFFGVYIGVSIYRDRLLGVRICGMAGHNIAMGFAMMILIIILVEKVVDNRIKSRIRCLLFILLIAAITCLLFSQSRLPIFLTIVFILYKYFYFRQKKSYRNFINIASILLLFFSMSFYQDDLNDVATDEENTIRYKTIDMAFDSFYNHPLLGYGWGSYGTPESVDCSSPAYDNSSRSKRIKQSINRGGTREAFLFQILIEFGLLGILLYYMPFILVAIYAYKKSDYNLFLIILLGFILQSILNGIYQMPVFFYLCLMTSYFFSHQHKLYKRNYKIIKRICQ